MIVCPSSRRLKSSQTLIWRRSSQQSDHWVPLRPGSNAPWQRHLKALGLRFPRPNCPQTLDRIGRSMPNLRRGSCRLATQQSAEEEKSTIQWNEVCVATKLYGVPAQSCQHHGFRPIVIQWMHKFQQPLHIERDPR